MSVTVNRLIDTAEKMSRSSGIDSDDVGNEFCGTRRAVHSAVEYAVAIVEGLDRNAEDSLLRRYS